MSLCVRMESMKTSNVKDCVETKQCRQVTPDMFSQDSHLPSPSNLHNLLSFSLPLFKLTVLNLSGQNMYELPSLICELPSLEILDVSNNNLTSLPDHLVSVHSLKELELSSNYLYQLPIWFGELSHCMRLGLGNNPFGPDVAFPANLGSLCRRLKYIQLNNTGLKGLPAPLLGLKDLRHLKLSNETIPENKTRLVSQTSKHQSLNLLTLPSLEPLQGLVKLEIVGTCLTLLPSTSSLVNLRILDCG